ncbi:MAG: hypothetical protein A3C35_02155 [Omnitrophica bacterium RIFCSPHIGHO2_02_FULL_46_11]|nr:MAG: hypothetical protein A3C35_02155 [Omnitrophica bacterium RIFCSPHIGHO2_02_FULL_46_11]
MLTEHDVLRTVEDLLLCFRHQYDDLLLKYSNRDLRLTFVAAPGNVLRSYQLFFAMVTSTITHESWWGQAFGRTTLDENDKGAIKNLDTMTRFAFFVFFLSHIEWSMKKLVTHISPGTCKNGSAKFKAIYDHLLTKLNLSKYIQLYDLCRMVRNCIHSNGIFIPENGQDIVVSWQDVNYSFRKMWPIDFMTHEVILRLYRDLSDSIKEIITHPMVEAPSFMEDNFKP